MDRRHAGKVDGLCPTIKVKGEGESQKVEKLGCSRGRRMENCEGEAAGRKNGGSALVKEIIRGLIKYSAISSASIGGCWPRTGSLSSPSRNLSSSKTFRTKRSLSFPVSSSERNRRSRLGRIRISKIQLSTLTRVKVEGGREMGLGWTNPVVKFSLN